MPPNMFPMELFPTDLSTAERIAVGVLSLIALIVFICAGEVLRRIKRKKGRDRRTSEAISIRKSWKPSEGGASSGLQRLVGDFVYEDHFFFDLMINHRVQ